MTKWQKIVNFLDKPIFWFLLVFVVGMMIVEESYRDWPAVVVFMFAVIVWEYERRKRGR